jgi:hypothetical protein
MRLPLALGDGFSHPLRQGRIVRSGVCRVLVRL